MTETRAAGWRPPDGIILWSAVVLLGAGTLLAVILSPHMALRSGLDSHHFAVRHALHVLVAVGIMLAVSQLNERIVLRMGTLLCVVSFLAVLALHVFGTDYGKGSVRWLSMGAISVQPSEFVKTGSVLVMAWLFSADTQESGLLAKTGAFAVAAVVALLLAVQPDVGQAVLLMLVWGVMYLLVGASFVVLLLLLAMTALSGVMTYFLLPHVRSRVDMFLSGIEPAHSQLDKVDRALDQGGLLGRLMGSDAARIHIPDGHSDFAAASIAAEFGLVVCMVLLLTFAVIGARATTRLYRLQSPFAQLAVAGLLALMLLQALLHFGVNFRLLPATGMTLPMVSYGGSSLLATGISMGAILALVRGAAEKGQNI